MSVSYKPPSQKYHDNQSDVNMSGNEDEERERSILLDDRVASSIVRAKCLALIQDPN